jgi:hypothetical protein
MLRDKAYVLAKLEWMRESRISSTINSKQDSFPKVLEAVV